MHAEIGAHQAENGGVVPSTPALLAVPADTVVLLGEICRVQSGILDKLVSCCVRGSRPGSMVV